MVSSEIEITNLTGLHARPASELCAMAKQYSSKITITCGEKVINPRSVVSILMGEVTFGKKVTIISEGEDEQLANHQLAQFLGNLRE